MIAIIPEPVIGMPGTLIGIVRNPHANSVGWCLELERGNFQIFRL
jgi:hypothetical protein